jgi:hypothetical protein
MGSPDFLWAGDKHEKAFNLPASPQFPISANVTLSFRSGSRKSVAGPLR